MTIAAAICIYIGFAPGAASAAERIQVTARAVELNPEDPAQFSVGALRYRGGLELASRDRRFGGLSALMVDADGNRALALTDKGHAVTLELIYDSEAGLAGIAGATIVALAGADAMPLSRRDGDAESLAPVGLDSAIVAFEGHHRLWRYRRANGTIIGPPSPLPPPPGLGLAPNNGGIEALTVLADGRILAIAENLVYRSGPFVAWLGNGRSWNRLAYRRSGEFKPTGATTLPSGDVLVLERYFSILGGLAIRVMRVDPKQITRSAAIVGTEIARLEPPLTVDNFEGIDARRGESGETLIYLVADDNFQLVQRNLLLMFALDDAPPETGR